MAGSPRPGHHSDVHLPTSIDLPDRRADAWSARSAAPGDPTDRMASVEELGSLAAGIAHAFSNALTAIGGSAELLRTRIDDPAAFDAAFATALARSAPSVLEVMVREPT